MILYNYGNGVILIEQVNRDYGLKVKLKIINVRIGE